MPIHRWREDSGYHNPISILRRSTLSDRAYTQPCSRPSRFTRGMNTPLRLTAAEVSSKPFPYFVSPEALQPDTSQNILAWLETDVPWQLVKTDFYEQFEFSLWDVLLPRGLSFLRSPFFSDIHQKAS